MRAFLFSVIYFSFSYFSAVYASCPQQQCVVIVDAGSTGSRIHYYSYDLDETNSAVHITEQWVKKINPGLANVDAKQNVIDDYLNNLFAGAPMHQVPVYFFATGGMRLLSQKQQEQKYALISQWFQQHSDWPLKNAKTISGSEEGIFGWLAINYQLNTFTNDNQKPGMMDMGGASVQIVFPVENAQNIDARDIKDITLYGHHFKLFVHSFLGLGQTEVTHQFIDNPSCFIDNYQLPTGNNGQGDAYTCENDVANLMNNVHHVNQMVPAILNANPVKQWYVMGGLAEMIKNKPFRFLNPQLTSQMLLDQADGNVCHQDWGQLAQQFPNDDYLYGYCLFSAYYYALMVEGYGIAPNSGLNYFTSSQGSDWTTGAVLLLGTGNQG